MEVLSLLHRTNPIRRGDIVGSKGSFYYVLVILTILASVTIYCCYTNTKYKSCEKINIGINS